MSEMKWCALCGEPVNFDSAQGSIPWHENQDGLRCYCPTTSNRDWKAAERREEAERDTTTIAGKFAEALGCLEDVACYLRDIDKQYDAIYPDDECEYPELEFWFAIDDAIKPLERIQKGLEAAEELVPKGVEPSKEGMR